MCTETKPLSEFRVSSKRKLGVTPACKSCLRAKDKERYASPETRKRRLEYANEYYKSNTQRMLGLRKENHARKRRAVLVAYGGRTPSCVCCGESRDEFLTIDHINGNGAAHRRSLGKNAGSLQVWRSLIADNFPSGYQVLCWNCNVAKHIYGVCPHAA